MRRTKAPEIDVPAEKVLLTANLHIALIQDANAPSEKAPIEVRQLGLFEQGAWGGPRPHAGRPAGRRTTVPHRTRPTHQGAHPAHVTLRLLPGLPSLRRPAFEILRSRFARASREWFRLIHFSVQANHIHFIVEAEDTRALSRGMQGLAVRIARAVNLWLGRRGRVFAERYHARALTRPRTVREALVYVLANWKHHQTDARGVDPCSSGPWFDGWRSPRARWRSPPPTAPARTWLLRVGWRRHGLVGLEERPRER